jgi:hypothetical protein
MSMLWGDLMEIEYEKFQRIGFPKEFAELYTYAKMDLFELRSRWRIYKSFFGTNEERFNLLFSISGYVSGTLERTLYDATLLGLRRITDKPKWRRGNRSVTINAFPEFFEGYEQEQMRKLVGTATQSCEFAKNLSDKRIAHSDYSVRSGAEGVQSASRHKVTVAVDNVASIFKWIEETRFNTTLITHPIQDIQDEIHFLQHIFEGKKSLEEKKKTAIDEARRGNHLAWRTLYNFPEWLEREDDIFDVE